MENKWLTSKEIRSILKISSQSLWQYEHNGKLKVKKINGKKFYLLEQDDPFNDERINLIYSRVSNTKQKKDLDRQENLLREYAVKNGFKVDKSLSDIASGMNENRKGFNELIDLVIQNKVNKIFISYKDRLTRFGFNYFVYLFRQFGTEIEIVNLTKEEDFQTELTQDLISIIHHFSMKLYSNRRKLSKKFKKDLENSKNE